METQRKETPMILTPNDTLYHCEACDGYALVTQANGMIRVTPCLCQFEEEENN
jgi:hypothetical protein